MYDKGNGATIGAEEDGGEYEWTCYRFSRQLMDLQVQKGDQNKEGKA